MAKKRKPSEMPEGIDLEEWEEMVSERAAAIRYDEEFLKLCEWFISADAAADVVGDQFTRCLSDKDRQTIENLLRWLSFMGYCMQEPMDYWKADVDDFIEASWYDDKTTPRAIVEPMLRLIYAAMNSIIDMRDKNNFKFW